MNEPPVKLQSRTLAAEGSVNGEKVYWPLATGAKCVEMFHSLR